MIEQWIQKVIKKLNRVRNYLKKKYGNKAFTDTLPEQLSKVNKAIHFSHNF